MKSTCFIKNRFVFVAQISAVGQMPPKEKAAAKVPANFVRTRTHFAEPGLTRKPVPEGQKLLPTPLKPGVVVKGKVTPKRLPKAPPKREVTAKQVDLGIVRPPPPRVIPSKPRPTSAADRPICMSRSPARSTQPAPIAAPPATRPTQEGA